MDATPDNKQHPIVAVLEVCAWLTGIGIIAMVVYGAVLMPG